MKPLTIIFQSTCMSLSFMSLDSSVNFAEIKISKCGIDPWIQKQDVFSHQQKFSMQGKNNGSDHYSGWLYVEFKTVGSISKIVARTMYSWILNYSPHINWSIIDTFNWFSFLILKFYWSNFKHQLGGHGHALIIDRS